MKNIFYPDRYVQSIFEADYEKMWESGIRGIIFDIDNTLVPYDVKEPTQEIKDFINVLRDRGFRVLLLSNNTKLRVTRFNQSLKINALHNAWKPRRVNILRAIDRLKLQKNQVAIIGDQIFTDILGGNRTGIMTILVEPVSEKDEPITKIKRGIERRIVNKYLRMLDK